MDEDRDVTQVADGFGSVQHRSAEIQRCANGYIVRYRLVRQKASSDWNKITSEKRVFLNWEDAGKFLEAYFVS